MVIFMLRGVCQASDRVFYPFVLLHKCPRRASPHSFGTHNTVHIAVFFFFNISCYIVSTSIAVTDSRRLRELLHRALTSDRVTPFGVAVKSAILKNAVTAPSLDCRLLQSPLWHNRPVSSIVLHHPSPAFV